MTQPYTLIDIQKWPRKEHYAFYRTFVQPYFQIAVELDVAPLMQFCKANGHAFFHGYMYLTLKAINASQPMCSRIVEDQVRIYQNVSVSVTVMAPDDTIRFCRVPFQTDFSSFSQGFEQAKQAAVEAPFLSDPQQADGKDKATVYCSVIPWLSFTGYSHAIHAHDTFGIPRLVFGKVKPDSHKMPIAIDAHHALVDGLHVAQFVQQLEQMLLNPDSHF